MKVLARNLIIVDRVYPAGTPVAQLGKVALNDADVREELEAKVQGATVMVSMPKVVSPASPVAIDSTPAPETTSTKPGIAPSKVKTDRKE